VLKFNQKHLQQIIATDIEPATAVCNLFLSWFQGCLLSFCFSCHSILSQDLSISCEAIESCING